MNAKDHLDAALRIEASMRKCSDDDHEMTIEAAMLAATHRLNASLHAQQATHDGDDVMHSYLLTINEYRRLKLFDARALEALGAIEDLRPAWVRGNHPGGAEAAQRASQLLDLVRRSTTSPKETA